MALSNGDRQSLLSLARMTLQAYVKTGRLPEIELSSPGLVQAGGAVVTLQVLGRPRGVASSLEANRPLYRAVMDLVARAADDEAGGMIDAEELHQVRIQIAVLSDIRPMENLERIQVGETGLAIPGDPATILMPEAAAGPGWNGTQYVQALCVQAGLPVDAWQTVAGVLQFCAEVFAEEDIE